MCVYPRRQLVTIEINRFLTPRVNDIATCSLPGLWRFRVRGSSPGIDVNCGVVGNLHGGVGALTNSKWSTGTVL